MTVGVHYRLDDGSLWCGAADGPSTDWREPWRVTCAGCLEMAARESIDQPTEPHPFRYPSHCVTCHVTDPARAFRRDAPVWSGRW